MQPPVSRARFSSCYNPNGLIDDISRILWSDSPDLSALHSQLEEELDISGSDAQAMIFQVVAQLNASLFPPITKLELIHTEGCNLACTYCFEKDMLGYRRMTENTAKEAVDLLLEYSGNSPRLSITHFGGEPTLTFSAIKTVTEYAEKRSREAGKSIEFNMTSNGTIINDRMAEYFADHKIMVLLSIDGLAFAHDRYRVDKRGRGTFDKAKKGLDILKKTQRWVGVKMTVMPANVHRIFEDVVGLYEMGVNQFIIGYATGIDWPQDAGEQYFKEISRIYQWYKEKDRQDLRISEFDEIDHDARFFGCQAGKISITAAVDGEISPCSKILALNNKQLLGKLGDVHYGLTHFRNRSDLVHCGKLRAACEEQGIADKFQGGCFASNYESNKDMFKPNLQDHRFSLLQRMACAGCKAG